MRENIVLLSALEPGPKQRRTALAVAVTLFIAFLSALAFRGVRLPYVEAYIPVVDSIRFLNDLITAALLYAQYSVGRQRGVLALATGYLFTSLIVVPHLLTFPGAFAPAGLLGANPQSSAWLYVFCLLSLPSAVIVYALLEDNRNQMTRPASATSPITASVVGVLALVVALTWLATRTSLLPSLMVDVTRPAWFWSRAAAPTLLIVNAAAIGLLWRRSASVLHMWLLLALWAWFLEVLLTSLSPARFTLPWYAAVFGVVASCFVLLVLLYDSTLLYARFALAAAARDREGERQRLTLQVVASSVAHELRQPLATIMWNSRTGQELLAKTPPDLPQTCAALGDILSASCRAADTIDSIKAALQGAEQPKTLIDIGQLVRDTLTHLRLELRSNAVTVQLEAPPELPAVQGNKTQLVQVLANLITNALEAMHGVRDRPRLLRIRCSLPVPGKVAIVVEDSGVGVEPQHAARVFDPFFTTKFRGTGLGLAICRRIVEAHGGRISLSRGSQYGSIFEILLPTT